jgi:hypothetical protein
MNCENAIELMNAAIDGTINANEQAKLERHLETCESCTIEFEDLKYLVQVMGDTDLKALPLGFEEELHEKLVTAASEIQQETGGFSIKKEKMKTLLNRFSQRKWQYGLAAVAVFAVVFVMSGPILNGFRMGASSVSSMRGASDSVSPEAYEGIPETTAATIMFSEAMDSSAMKNNLLIASGADGSPEYGIATEDSAATGAVVSDGTDETYRTDRLIIYSANLSVSLEDYEGAVASIESWVNASGGYIENSSTNVKAYLENQETLKYGYLTLRVPVGEYTSIVENIKSLGLVTSENSYADDVTKQYRDTANTIENLKVTEARLREIMNQATDVSDILEIENELTRIRGQIDNYEQQIKDWEALADLATIQVSLDEVESLTPVIEPIDNSLWTRAKEAFIGSINALSRGLENIFIWLVANVIYLIIWFIIGVIAYRVYLKRRKK